MEAGWDPFGDPADDSERSFVKAACKSVVTVDADLSEGHVPLDPWNDVTFVSLVQEAAREAKEQEEATLKLLAEQQEEEEQKQIEREARRLKLEQQARELAKLSLPERRQKLREREAYTEFAMEAIQQAPAFVAAAAERKSRSRELEVPQPDDPEVALGRAAAEIAAANMGVKINFKTKAEARALGRVPSNCSRHRLWQPSRAEATCPMALLFPDQNSKSLKMLRGLQVPSALRSKVVRAQPLSVCQEFAGARRLRETARALLDFDPLEGPGFQGFYELLRGPEGPQ